jgi:heterodisulfide reductase subunit B
MDHLMRALGAEPVPWDSKVTCCGASLALTQTEIVLDMSRGILDNARARGADLVAVACPLCHSNLDARQMHMGDGPRLPVAYFTQLMALAFGLPEHAALERNLVDPRPLLMTRGLL